MTRIVAVCIVFSFFCQPAWAICLPTYQYKQTTESYLEYMECLAAENAAEIRKLKIENGNSATRYLDLVHDLNELSSSYRREVSDLNEQVEELNDEVSELRYQVDDLSQLVEHLRYELSELKEE